MSKNNLKSNDDFFSNLLANSDNSSIYQQAIFKNTAKNEGGLRILVSSKINISILESFMQMPNHWDLKIEILNFDEHFPSDKELLIESQNTDLIISDDNLADSFLSKLIESELDSKELTFVDAFSVYSRLNLAPSECNYSFNQIAGQKQLMSRTDFDKIENQCFHFLNLGQLRSDFSEAEVILRNSDFLDFNILALRKDQNMQNPSAPLCGLSIEEACTLMKYAGASSKIKLINIHGLNFDNKSISTQSEIIGHLIWYFTEGIQFRTSESFKNKKEYLVGSDLADMTFRFLEDQDSGKWFVNFPDSENQVFSCHEKDYEMARNNKISPRIMRLLSDH